jgi:hypothetical protein
VHGADCGGGRREQARASRGGGGRSRGEAVDALLTLLRNSRDCTPESRRGSDR